MSEYAGTDRDERVVAAERSATGETEDAPDQTQVAEDPTGDAAARAGLEAEVPAAYEP